MAVTTKSHEMREPSRALNLASRLARTFSGHGLVVGTLFFALSLTPSLLPRSALIQGLVSGILFAVGYGLGVLGHVVLGGREARPEACAPIASLA